MNKWEYCEVEYTIGGPLSGKTAEGWIFKSNGQHVEIEGKFGQLFAKLGEDGWELVASSARIETGLTNKHKINYIFKRPISSP